MKNLGCQLQYLCSDISLCLIIREFWQATTATATRPSPKKRFNEQPLCISLPSSPKQQREMSNLHVFWRMCTAMANFSGLPLELNIIITFSA